MLIQRIGTPTSAEANTVAIPTGHQAGDLLLMFAFRDGNTTNPTVPAGWNTLTNTLDGTSCSASVGWKLAVSAADTSGTWTNASVLCCFCLRNIATNKTPLGTGVGTAGTTNTNFTYGVLNPLKCAGTSWIVAFIAHRQIDTNIETAPDGLFNQTNTVGAATEVAGHDSNGVISAWPSTNVSGTGTNSGWITYVIEIFAEQGYPNNYQFVDTLDGMSAGEKIV